jgi:hypothetical protein
MFDFYNNYYLEMYCNYYRCVYHIYSINYSWIRHVIQCFAYTRNPEITLFLIVILSHAHAEPYVHAPTYCFRGNKKPFRRI